MPNRCAFADRDAVWYERHLSDDFVCTFADGRRVRKHEFLRHLAEQPPAETVGCDEVDVQLLDRVALVHGVLHHPTTDSWVLVRYTMIWQALPQRWQAAALQFTALNDGPARSSVFSMREPPRREAQRSWARRLAARAAR
jgi:Domain of unknown function (DUF4440)